MAQFEVRPAQAGDARAMAQLFASVAAEGDGIATEPPVDIDEVTEPVEPAPPVVRLR